ncbi:LysR family transcriptional regulator [Sphingomonas natans]|uniref:LysR family transcriptional regulator n=1 Tax=Sphingomonas natans TaxID=3063330 RepID=UPI0026E1C3CC|nr:LysR family transcriptional regulator [Sphingomonas sp. BIUV-7]
MIDVAVFVEAVGARSLAGSARRLGIAPMAASRRLAALETELGTRLVHRTTRALSLTPEGEAFLPHAQAMLEGEMAARNAVRPSDAGASGMLRITASIPFGLKVVAPFVAEFLATNPEVQVDLLMADGIIDIVGNGIDLAIRIAHLRDSSLIARKLAANPRGLYASPGYLESRGDPEVIDDLENHECLTITGSQTWSFMATDGKPIRRRVRSRFSASSPEALREVSLRGAGIALLSEWSARADISAGRLVEIKLKDAAVEPLDIWAVHPTARLVPAKTRLFIAAFEMHLRRGRPPSTCQPDRRL